MIAAQLLGSLLSAATGLAAKQDDVGARQVAASEAEEESTSGVATSLTGHSVSTADSRLTDHSTSRLTDHSTLTPADGCAMSEEDSELPSYTESRLDSSFSKSHIYEKLVRKQMSSGDREISSFLKDTGHNHRSFGQNGETADHHNSFEGSHKFYSDHKSTDYLSDSQSSYSRKPLSHSDHYSSSHYLEQDFQPIANRSVSVDNLNSRNERQRSHSYDGRLSADRERQEIHSSAVDVYQKRTSASSHAADDTQRISEQKFLSGLPPMSPSRRSGSSEKRSSTPDSLSQTPTKPVTGSSPGQLKSPLIPSRSSPSSSSRPSSRSSIPVSSSSGKDDATKIQDLEDTIVTLKKLLSDRDKETNLVRKENQDLHATNCQLKTQLGDLKKAEVSSSSGGATDVDNAADNTPQPPSSHIVPATKTEYEQKINQLINERENLETEMWKLRQQLGERADGTATDNDASVLDNYKPNNPYALQRKISELESQIQDLQEANETSVSRNSKSEKEIQALRLENEKLREQLANSRKDLEAENQMLKEEVKKLQYEQAEGAVVNGSLDEYSLQREVGALRQDLRFLREKNHQLNEDNIKLIEHLQDLRRREKEQTSLPAQHHIPGGIRDKYTDDMLPTGSIHDKYAGDRLPAGGIRDKYTDSMLPSENKHIQEFRKFSPIPSKDGEKDFYPYISSPPSKYSSGNIRPHSQKKEEPLYRYEQFNGSHKNSQGDCPSPYSVSPALSDSEASDCTATLTRAVPNGYNADERASTPILSHYDDPLISKTQQRASTDIRQNLSHSMDLKPHRQQHQLRSILRKKASPISLELRETDFTSNSAMNRSTEAASVSDLVKSHKRSGSAGSSSSLDSILDELEQEFGVSVGRPPRRRSRARSAGSVEEKTPSLRSTSPAPSNSAGFRSVSPKPIATQHNFNQIPPSNSYSDEMFSTHGKRPFAPRNPADIHIHDIVKFARHGGRICRGLVKFIGHLPGRNDAYIGVELDKDEGKHDGTFETVRYFKCKPNKGVFVAFNKVVMAWGS